MEWIINHKEEIFAIFGTAVALVTAITKLTATTKDDTFWAKVLKVLSLLSLVNPDGSIIGKKENK